MVSIQLHHHVPLDSRLWTEWKALSGSVPMCQPEWLMTWWDVYAPAGADLFLVGMYEDDRLVGLAPWYRLGSEREVRMLGDGIVCTDYCSILVDTKRDDHAALQGILVEWLMHHRDDQDIGWNSLVWEGIPETDTLLHEMAGALSEQGCMTLQRNPMNTWCIDLSEGWDAFLIRIRKDTRKLIRRRLETLEQATVHWVRTSDDWHHYFQVLVDLHQRRRNSIGEAGCFADPRFARFLETASLRLLASGQLQAFYLECGGRPIAADIGFRSNTHWYCYQGGIEPDALELEPGKMANVWIMSQAESQGIQYVDFLRGDEPYKRQLRAEPTPIHDLWIAPPGLRGLTQKWWWQSRQMVSHTAKSFLESLSIPIPSSR
ncbi:MAG: GNAT family N-acetyltransferase [Pirellula sp.]|nr:GNAT family N-acetyltransferase [Pirellula sp.]